MSHFFVSRNGQPFGPYSRDEIIGLPDFDSRMLVWPEGEDGWIECAQIPELVSALTRPEPQHMRAASKKVMECPYCAEEITVENAVCEYCGSSLSREAIDEFQREIDGIRTADTGGEAPAREKGTAHTESQPKRAIATTMFAELCGVADLTEGRDSEAIRDLMNAIFSDLTSVIERYGGRIDKFIGEIIMAVWGIEKGQPEDPLRAVYAGRAMAASVRERSRRLDLPLSLRLGINTGEVVFGAVGVGHRAASTVIGDSVNLASRLCDSAQPDTILVGESVQRHVSGKFATEEKLFDLKGLGETKAYFVAAEKQLVGGSVHRVVTNFFVRDEKMEVIVRSLDTLRSEGKSASGIVVTGHGGTGKSRMCAHVLAHHADGFKVLFAQNVPTDTPVMGGVIIAWLGAIFGGTDIRSVDEFLRVNSDLAEHRNDIILLLGERGQDSKEKASRSAERLDQRFARFFVKISEATPLVLSTADAQWMDDLSIEVCVAICEAREMGVGRLMLVADGRPGDNITRLSQSAGVIMIELSPMTQDGVRNFLSTFIDGEIPDQWIASLRLRTGGIFLHLNQVLDLLAEEEELIFDDRSKKWRVTNPDKDLPVPDSLAELLSFRIEHLKPLQREVLYAAGVCGLRFPREILGVAMNMSEAEFGGALEELSDEGFLSVRGSEIVFDHGSIRQAARRGLLQSERKLIAERIVNKYGRRLTAGERRPYAENLFRDADRIGAYNLFLAHEANRLISAWRLDSARNILSGISGESGDDIEGKKAHYLALFARARIAEYSQDLDGALTFAMSALEAVQQVDDISGLSIMYGAIGRIHAMRGEVEAGAEYSKKAYELDRQQGDRGGQAVNLNTMGRIAERAKDWDAAHRFHSQAYELDRMSGNILGMTVSLGSLGRIAERQKDWASAQHFYLEALSHRDWTIENPQTQQINLAAVGRVARKRDDFPTAIAYVSRALQIARAVSDKKGILIRLMDLARISRYSGNLNLAKDFAHRVMHLAEETGCSRDLEIGKEFLQQLGENLTADGGNRPVAGTAVSEDLRCELTKLDQPAEALDEISLSPLPVIVTSAEIQSSAIAPPSDPPAFQQSGVRIRIEQGKDGASLLVNVSGMDSEPLRNALSSFRPSRAFRPRIGGHEWGFYVNTNDDALVRQAMIHALPPRESQCYWVHLPDGVKGPYALPEIRADPQMMRETMLMKFGSDSWSPVAVILGESP